MRVGIIDALFDARPSRVSVLIAPTGYGKTSAVHYSWKEILSKWGRVVHVFPLRALVSNVCSDAIERGFPVDLISYQAMLKEIEIEGYRIRKSPYMFSPYAITTYDSFLTSIYVAPIAELSRVHAHRDTGLLAASGGVLLDEVHLALSVDKMDDIVGEWRKILTSIVFTLEVLSFSMDRPTTLLTATLPREILQYIGSNLRKRGVEIVVHLCLGQRGLRYYNDAAQNIIRWGLDENYVSLYDKYNRISLTEVSKRKIEEDIIRALDWSQNILVFCNTVHRAVEIYRKIKETVNIPVLLLHARLAEKHKENILKNIKELMNNKGNFILVSTQCLEAGANFDFDTVVTEIAPPSSLIQRAGRAIRNLEKRLEHEDKRTQLIINVSEDSIKSANEVYPPEFIEALFRRLNIGVYFIDWRFGEAEFSFIDLLATTPCNPEIDLKVLSQLKDLLKISFIREETIKNILRKLDDNMKGSLLRDGALIPLLVKDDIVAVSLKYLRNNKDILEFKNNNVVAILDNGEALLNFEKLVQTPLSTLYELNRIGRFLGLKVKDDVYNPEVGLI
jgi:CRISPR-associated endonuclease/helicase Cas3